MLSTLVEKVALKQKVGGVLIRLAESWPESNMENLSEDEKLNLPAGQ